jgi:hypothetical protein
MRETCKKCLDMMNGKSDAPPVEKPSQQEITTKEPLQEMDSNPAANDATVKELLQAVLVAVKELDKRLTLLETPASEASDETLTQINQKQKMKQLDLPYVQEVAAGSKSAVTVK